MSSARGSAHGRGSGGEGHQPDPARVAAARTVLDRVHARWAVDGTSDADDPPTVTGGSARDTAGRPRAGRGVAERHANATGESEGDADPESVARTIALRALSAAPRSRAELERRLLDRDVPLAVATAVLDRFEGVGLIDDAAYAGMLVRSRHDERGLARRAIAVELRRKGVEEEILSEALTTIDDESELQAATRVVGKRLRTMSGLEPHVQRRRLVGTLARKGYGSATAMRAVELGMAIARDGDVAVDPAAGEVQQRHDHR